MQMLPMNECKFFFWKAELKFEIILIIEAESKFEIILIIELSFQRGKTKGTFAVFRKKRLGKLM